MPKELEITLEDKIMKKRITTQAMQTVACLAKLNISSSATLQLLIKSLGPELQGTTLYFSLTLQLKLLQKHI